MNNEDIFEAFGRVGDEDLEQCEAYNKRKRISLSRIAAIAACAAVLIAAPFCIKALTQSGAIGGPESGDYAGDGNNEDQTGELPKLEIAPLHETGAEGTFTRFTFAPDAAISPRANAMIYNASPAAVGEDTILLLAEKLGMEDYSVTRDAGGALVSVSDGKGNSVLVMEGSVSCSKAGESSAAEPKEGPSDAECISIARGWLEGTGLLTDDYLTKAPQVAENGFVTKMVNGSEVSFPTLKTVTFMYMDLDGLEVNGVAPRIIVDISLEGEVVSVDKIQREFTEYIRYPLITTEEARRNLENGVGVLYCSGETGAEGVITSVRPAYYNPEVGADCRYLCPVYVFEGESGEGRFTAITYALSWEYYKEAGK